MEPKDQVHRGRKKMMVDNFLGGISWAIGAFIGGTIIIAALGFLIAHMNVVPFVGNFVGQIVNFIEVNQPQYFPKTAPVDNKTEK